MKRERTIIIAGWHTDNNKGDQAILLSLINTLSEKLPNIKYYVQLCFHYTHPHFAYMLDDTTKKLNSFDINPLTSFFPYYSGKLKVTKYLFYGYYFLRSLLILCFPRFIGRLLLTEGEYDSLKIYFKSDALVGKGGHYIYGGKSLRCLYSQFLQSYPFFLARRLGIEYFLIGVSVGPFSSLKEKIIPYFLFKQAKAISLREECSFYQVKRLINKTGKITLSCDLSFALNLEKIRNNNSNPKVFNKNLPSSYIIFCPRAYFPNDEKNRRYERYIQASKNIIKDIYSTFKLPVIVMLNSVGKDIDYSLVDDDRDFSIRIKNELGSNINMEFISDYQDICDILSLYRNATLVIGTRLHSLIFSILVGVPFIGIAYIGAKFDIFRMIGLGDYIFEIESLDKREVLTTINMIIKSREQIIKKIINGRAKARMLINSDSALTELFNHLNTPEYSKCITGDKFKRSS